MKKNQGVANLKSHFGLKMKTNLYFLLYLTTIFLISGVSFADTGYVTKIIDGDSFVIRGTNNKKIEMRLSGIDSPEWNQKNSKYATTYLKRNIFKKKIIYKVIDYDRYGRIVAIIEVAGVNINKDLVRKGYAWVYPRYCKEKYCKYWKALQKNARKKRIGLWKEKNPISPWRWRQKK